MGKSADTSPASAATGHPDGLATRQQVVEVADQLSTVADRLHERIMDELASYAEQAVPAKIQATLRQLQDDEAVIRQRANGLYADAAAHIVKDLGQPQARLVALTAAAAEKIRRIGVIGEVTSLVGGVLALAGGIAAAQATPIVLALEKIHLHATALDALPPAPAKPPAPAA